MGPEPRPFLIVVVCAANVCRSQAARAVLRDRLTARRLDAEISVASAGVSASVGAPSCSEMVRLGTEALLGADWPGSRALSPDDLADAHLLLTADRWAEAQIIRAGPAARSKTFTMVEAGALAESVAGARSGGAESAAGGGAATDLLAVVTEMNYARGTIAPPVPSAARRTGRREQQAQEWRDVPDLHSKRLRRTARAHRRTFDVIDGSMTQLADALASLTRRDE